MVPVTCAVAELPTVGECCAKAHTTKKARISNRLDFFIWFKF
jgi:hypothetical protein